ncbi:hypothetical protein Tco_0158109 [Tanacetum coccineum]
MSITKEQQQALDDALVPREQRLQIGSCNYRLSTTFKPKEPTFQVALDVLSLTPFYPAFLITASVPAIYMHEFWTSASYHKHSIRFKLNTKRYSFDLDTFRNMLQICPKLPGQQFVDPPFEEEILTFMRELGYPGNIKLLAQILWGLYHQQKVDYAYLLWEDLVFQIENKESRKNKYMFYPRFTKVIINHFMSQDQSIPRRNKVDWHMANDDPILTTMRFIPQHEVVQKYGAILPDNLTTQAMKESEAYKTYYAFATGKAIPKPKYVRRTTKEKTIHAPKASSGKRIKSAAKVTKSGKNKQPVQGLETLSEITLGSGVDEGTGVKPGVPDVPTYGSDDQKISWKSSKEEDDNEVAVNNEDDVNDDDNDNADNQDDEGQEYDEHDDEEQGGDDDEQTDSDNDGDDFAHPKVSTHDEKDKEEDSFDPRGDKMNEEETNEEAEVDALYRDVNVNLEGRDTEMTDAPRTISSSVSFGFVSNMFNPSPETGIDSLFNLNTESTSLVDVPVTTFSEPPLLSATTLPPPPTPLITHLQQTPVLTLPTIPSSSLQDLPNFGSLFGFDHRLKTFKNNFSEFNQTNQFAAAVSLIPSIVDAYLANKMHEAVKKVDQVKEQVKAQVYKILLKIKKTVNEQLEAEVLTHSSNESKTSHAITANLSELELKKILIDKMESNKHRDDEDKDEEPSVGSNRGSKRRRDGKEPESTNAPKEKTSKISGKSTEGSKSHHKSAGESAQAKELMHTAKYLEEPAHQEFEI